MASVLLRLGILFTIAVTNSAAQGHEDYWKDVDPDPGLVLVPGPHRIVAQKKMPLLMNCSINITNTSIQILKYEWYKDGKLINTSRSRTQLYSNGSLLIYPKRKKSEGKRWRKSAGLYDCNVTMTTGSVIARRVEVVVASIATSFTHLPVNQSIYEGGVARFECDIKAEPRAIYVWHKDNVQLSQDNDRYDFLPSGVLHILAVQLSDAGHYWCQAAPYIQRKVTNLRWRRSPMASLKVIPGFKERKPTIVAGPKDVTVEAGQTAHLECLADGWPRPTVSWKMRDTVTGDEHTYKPPRLNANLVIPQVTPENAGNYVCIVSGQGVEQTVSATLNVITPPKMIKEPRSARYPVAKTTTIDCQFEGNPLVYVSWYFNGKLQPSSKYNTQSLVLYSLRPRHSGYYQCIGNNSVGQVIGLAYIKISVKDGAPVPPENVTVRALNSTTAVVIWDYEPGEEHFVMYYGISGKSDEKNYLCGSEGENKKRCWLGNLQPDTHYYVSIQAFNKKTGGSQRSEDVPFVTPKEMSKKLSPVFKLELLHKSHSVKITWQPLADTPVGGYRIYYRSQNGRNEANFKAPSNQTSFIITDLELGSSYEIVVLAVLAKGHLLERSKWPWQPFHTSKDGESTYFTVTLVNSTSVKLQWNPPMPWSRGDAISGYMIELRLSGHDLAFMKYDLPLTSSHVLTKLDEDTTYEVTLIAKNSNGALDSSSKEFNILDLLLVQEKFWAEDIEARSMVLKWSSVPHQGVSYEVCYSLEFEAAQEKCQQSAIPSYNLTDLQPNSRYELRLRAVYDNMKGQFNKNIIVRTEPLYPSEPLNVTVEVIGKGSVNLHWAPVEHPNGIVLAYIVYYGKEPVEQNGQIAWKEITTSGDDMNAEVADLDEVKYYFKVRAETETGMGTLSEMKAIVPTCPHDVITCKGISRPSSTEGPDDKVEDKRQAGMPPTELAAIIFGVLLGIAIILVLLFIWCRRRCVKSRDDDPNTSHSPICPGNGHIPTMFNNSRPGNGHAHQLTSVSGDTTQPEEMTTPMLQVRENERSDSKGGNAIIGMPNGVRLNGFVRSGQWNGGQNLNHRYSGGDLNHSQNSDEMQGLIKAMIASTDGRNVIDGSGDPALMMSSLNDIDHTDPTLKTSDHSSEDSGTGCHRVGVNSRCNGLNSPASSPGGSSEANSSLGRRRNLSLEGGHWGDEMGGVVMDPATGTVIGMAFSSPGPQDIILKEEQEDDEWSPGSGQGTALTDEHASNDRDSGHGSEVKMHSMRANSSEEEHLPGLGGQGPRCQPPERPRNLSSSSTSRVPLEATDLPPPPPSPPCSPTPVQLPPPPSSSPQLPSFSSNSSRNKLSNKLHQTERLSHRHPRTNRLHTPLSELPPPPPPPPLLASNPPPTATTTAHGLRETPSTAIHNSEDRPVVGGESVDSCEADPGSSISVQSPVADVVFSRPPTTSSPPRLV